MNKKVIAMIGIVLAVIVFAIIAANKNTELIPEKIESVLTGGDENDGSGAPEQPVSTPQKSVVAQPPKQTTTTITSSDPKTFTLAQVAAHNTESDCYSAIDGKVYDLTAWINKHPGGDRNILRICGIDGSAAFDGQHGGESRPERILAGFEIGTLIK